MKVVIVINETRRGKISGQILSDPVRASEDAGIASLVPSNPCNPPSVFPSSFFLTHHRFLPLRTFFTHGTGPGCDCLDAYSDEWEGMTGLACACLF